MNAMVEGEPVGSMGTERLHREVVASVDALVREVEVYHELENGQTALYWHLLSIIDDHVKKTG